MDVKRLLCTALLWGFALTLWGQAGTPDVQVGPVQDESWRRDLLWLFGHSDAHFYALYGNARRLKRFNLVQMSTDSLKALSRTEFKLPEIKGLNPYIAFPLSTDRSDYLIATADAPDGTVYVMAFGISETGEVGQAPITIGQGRSMALHSEGGFTLFWSEEAQQTVLLLPEESNPEANERMQVRVFDADFSLVAAEELRLPYPSGKTLVEEALCDSASHVHMLVSVALPQADRRRKRDEVASEYTLVSFDPHTARTTEKVLSLGDKSLYEGGLLINDRGRLQVAGFYGNMLNLTLSGTFSLEMEPATTDLVHYGMYPFDRDFRLRFRATVKQRESDSGQFELDRIGAAGMDTTELISEMRYSQTTSVFNPASGTYSIIEINHYDEILVTRIAPDSRILQNILIPKMQSSSRELGTYLSYVSHRAGDTTYLVYNDNVRNPADGFVPADEVRPLTGSGSARPVVVSIDPKGKLQKQPLLPEESPSFALQPGIHHRTSNSLILTLYSGSRLRFVRMTP